MTHHYTIIATLLAMLAMQASNCRADNLVEAYQLTAIANDGTSQSIVLTKSDDFIGPRLYHRSNQFSINGKLFATSDIDHIRIEKTMVSAINEVNIDSSIKNDGKVYNINGQLVKDDTKSLSNLPKGIYIINGKKYIAK